MNDQGREGGMKRDAGAKWSVNWSFRLAAHGSGPAALNAGL